MSEFYKEIWEQFTAVDVKPLISMNQKVEYLTWSKVWVLIMDMYPASNYSFEDRVINSVGDNGPCETVEVSCTLNIVGDINGELNTIQEATRTMHLPVMQSFGQFKAIENPTARHISDARMRCLVKTAAMFGLGLSMWTGDEFQATDKTQERIVQFAKLKASYRMQLWKTAIVIKDAFEVDDATSGLEAWIECEEQEQRDLWTAESKGGFFTTKEKEWIRKLRITEE